MEKLLKQAIEKISHDKNKQDVEKTKELIMANSNYSSIPIDKNNFYAIERKESTKKFVFVDGGNQNIHTSTKTSIDAIRIYASTFKIDKKITSKKLEIIAITKAIFDENKRTTIYIVELESKDKIPLENNYLTIEGIDERNNHISIKEIAGKIRRRLEISFAKQIIEDSLDAFDAIILDGTLEYKSKNEESLIKELHDKALENKTLVIAIAKSTTIYTNTDEEYDELLTNLATMKRFVYYPAFKIKQNIEQKYTPQIFFIKLHEKSEFVLRADLFCDTASFIDIQKLFGQIAFFAKDPLVLGYPYGLVDADKFARISNEEINYLKNIYKAKSKRSTTDIHAKLDKIAF
jgi:hypothetical protein